MKAWKEEENFVEKSLVTTTTDPERWAPFGGRPVAVAAAVPRRPLLSMPPPLPLLPPPSPPPPPPPPAPEDEEDAVCTEMEKTFTTKTATEGTTTSRKYVSFEYRRSDFGKETITVNRTHE